MNEYIRLFYYDYFEKYVKCNLRFKFTYNRELS